MRRQQGAVRKPATKFTHLKKKMDQSKVRANTRKILKKQGK
ncbi:MAG TPA: hypothetical protein VGM76_14045 [Lacipirellulaceae bacterium]